MRRTAAVLVALLVGGCRENKSPPPPVASAEVKPPPTKPRPGELLTGQAALGDFSTDAPGVRRKITPADLPPPFATKSAENPARIAARPAGASPRVPDGFKVDLFAGGSGNGIGNGQALNGPRQARVAPNGDLFVVESESNRVRVLRDTNGDGIADITETFAESGLKQPFGVSFYPPGGEAKWVYIANTSSVVRFAYTAGDVKARAPAEVIIDSISGGGRLKGGGHWTRDVVFSKDGAKMYVSVGSRSNVSDDPNEDERARIFEFSPDGKNQRVFASGIRNPVGLAIHPTTGALWTSVNERDELGDHLVPDYITSVRDGGLLGGSGDDDLLRAGGQMLRRAVAVGELAGALEHHVHAQVFPGQGRGVLAREYLEFVAIHRDAVGAAGNRGAEVAEHRVVLEQMRQRPGIGEVIDTHEVDVVVGERRPHDVAPDPPEPVDAYSDRHVASSSRRACGPLQSALRQTYDCIAEAAGRVKPARAAHAKCNLRKMSNLRA